MKNYNKILEAVNRGIQLALDDFEDDQVQNIKSKQVQNRDYTKDYLDFIRDIEIGLRIYYETDITRQLLEDNYDLLLSFPFTPWSMLGILTRYYNQCQVYGPSTVEAVKNGWMEFDIHDETDTDQYNKAIFKIKQDYSEIFKDYMK